MAAKKQPVEISEAKIRTVIWMLKKGKTKKVCCEHLGIPYNTKKLETIIEEFHQKEKRTAALKEAARKNELSLEQKQKIAREYQQGATLSGLAEDYYLTSARIKSIIIEMNVPLRARSKKQSADVSHVRQDLDVKFLPGEKVYFPKKNTTAVVKEVFDEDWLEYHHQGKQRYVELPAMKHLKDDMEPKEDIHFNIYWTLENGSDWKLSALKEKIKAVETAIEETGRETYRVYVEGDYQYYATVARTELFPIQ